MEQSSFFNAEKTANGTYDRTYNAEDWAAYFATFVGNGVSCTPTNNLQVESSSGMNVIVNSGVAFINGYRYENTTPLTVQINQANSTYDRITSIILELNLNNRNIICTTLDGTAEPNPQPPTLIRTDSIYQLQLATVYVSAGATNCGAITDTRENTQVCGFLELLAPTLPPTLIKNCDFQNVSLHDDLNNYGTINGGTISNATLNNVNITGDVNCYTTINGGALLYALLKECTLNNPTLNGGGWNNGTLNTPHIENGTCLNTSIVLETKNGAKLDYFCDGKSFRLTNPATWEDLITIPESMDEIDVNVPINTNSGTYNNPTLQGTITNKGTFNNNNSHIVGGSVQNIQIFNADLLGKVLNLTSIQGGTYNDPTLTGKVNINDGLFNNGNPIVNASSLNINNIHVQDNVTGRINLEYWALNAGLLSASPNGLLCGIIKATITLDQNCTWNNRNPIYLNVEGFPNANAMTVTYQKNFVVGCGENVIVLNGNNAYLNANQTYTEYALIYG